MIKHGNMIHIYFTTNANSRNCPPETSVHSAFPALFAKKNVTPAYSTRGEPNRPYQEGGPRMEASKEYWIPACKVTGG